MWPLFYLICLTFFCCSMMFPLMHWLLSAFNAHWGFIWDTVGSHFRVMYPFPYIFLSHTQVAVVPYFIKRKIGLKPKFKLQTLSSIYVMLDSSLNTFKVWGKKCPPASPEQVSSMLVVTLTVTFFLTHSSEDSSEQTFLSKISPFGTLVVRESYATQVYTALSYKTILQQNTH